MTDRIKLPVSSPIGKQIAYSRAVRCDRHVYVSGTTASGEKVPATASEQTLVILDRIKEALEGVGATLADIVETRVYLTDISEWQMVGAMHGVYFREIMPATTFVQVGPLISPELKVEISATAVIPA